MAFETIAIIVVLVVTALILIVTEICTPMFGLLGLLAIGCLALAVYLCFTINGVLGIVALVAALLGTPTFIIVAVRVLPKTPLGSRLALKRLQEAAGGGTPEAETLHEFVGREATAETVLRPSGMIRVDGHRIVAQAESGMIEKGAAVKIIDAAGSHVVVRQVKA